MGLFLISFSDYSLSVFRNTTDFCVLILYPVTLLNSFINYNSFSVESLEFSINKIMLSVNTDIFISSFSIFMLFIQFSCLAWLELPVLYQVEVTGVGILALIVILEEKLSVFQPLDMMLAIGFSYVFHYVEVVFFYLQFVECFDQ